MKTFYFSVSPSPKVVLAQVENHQITTEGVLFFLAVGVPIITATSLFVSVKAGLKALEEKQNLAIQLLKADLTGSINLVSASVATCLTALDSRNGTIEQLKRDLSNVTGNLNSIERQLQNYGLDINVRHNSK